jgi:hypothetical protein
LHKAAGWAARKWVTSYKLNQLRTTAYGVVMGGRRPTRLVLVFGCQRSGTTMLANALGLSPRVRDYGEGDPRYFHWEGAPRLRPLSDVADRLAQERHPFTLLKPLCDSQRAAEIMETFPQSRGLWIFRNYRECVASHVRYYRQFHDGLAYVREMLATEVPCWKNEGLAPDVCALLASYAHRPLNLDTAYALYWLARNSLLEQFPAAIPLKVVYYESILSHPATIQTAFEHLGIPYKRRYARIVTEPVFRRGTTTCEIEDNVAERCEALLARLQRRAADALAEPDATGHLPADSTVSRGGTLVS